MLPNGRLGPARVAGREVVAAPPLPARTGLRMQRTAQVFDGETVMELYLETLMVSAGGVGHVLERK
ncbi:MAG: hypothetical protein AB7S38_22200 [Vulcanimicrobiota bacterium]